MAPPNLFRLLERTASQSSERGVSFYSTGRVDSVGKRLTYDGLLQLAKKNGQAVRKLKGINPGSNVLLHFDNHFDNFVWMWSIIAAGYLPAISTPMTNDPEGRKRHLIHLQTVLNNPVVLTTGALSSDFSSVDTLNVQIIESMQSEPEDDSSAASESESSDDASSKPASVFDKTDASSRASGATKTLEDIAILMLTSGSSGNAKAVALSHGQILTAISGKSKFHGTTPEDVFLNWIGADHVASLTETHLHAMLLGADQFHVQAADLLAHPATFFDLIHKHRVSYTFAPNFFMATLKRTLEGLEVSKTNTWDLSCMRACISGGEANTTETARALTELMQPFSAPASIFRPGFGMTETCAGSIYNNNCPQVDIENNREFSCLGKCIPGLSMRITLEDGTSAATNQSGSLELSGPALFKEYYNNATATKESFTADGWFITGDLAFLDEQGDLVLAGRKKETIIINGVKYFPHELEIAIEEAKIENVAPSFTAAFAHRPKGSETEVLVVIYHPTFNEDDVEARVSTSDQIAKVSVMQCGARPYAIIPLDESLLPKSSLGKLSRAKLRTAFESGAYAQYQAADEKIIKEYRSARIAHPSNETEEAIMDCFIELFDASRDDIGVDTSFFDWGVSSIEIIKLKTLVQKRLKMETEIPVITVMTNPTIRALGVAVTELQKPHVYNPIVTLQPNGDKTPIFLVHPGVGEILVFLNLAKFFTDRPVYAIRARGFDEGEEFFKDIPEIVHTYHAAIKKTQPEGPYAIAGYSYGAMLAFETGKLLEAGGDKIGFMGSFNLPPNIKMRMRQLDWIEVLLNLSYFLDLFSEEYAHAISEDMHKIGDHSKVLDFIISKAAPARMTEMALTKSKLDNWATLSHLMHEIAHDYDPSGSVAVMDVFYAIPLSAVAKNKDEWMKNHLSKWVDYVRGDVRYTEVDGAHYTMMGPALVGSLQKKFKHALAERGL